MHASTPTPAPHSQGVTRCVLWHGSGAPIPADLRQSLDRRGVRIITCADSFQAMAHLCLLEHGSSASPTPRSVPSAARAPLVLVIIDPASLAEAGEVASAATRYAPHAACWWYQSATSKLQAVTDDDVAAWSRPTGALPRPEPVLDASGRPTLRLAGQFEASQYDGPVPAPSAVAEPKKSASPAKPSSALTDEELAMLLAGDLPRSRGAER
ncbi:MAG: hypothetical protein H7Y88_13280 [Phycisphaerales bacterium]|nr:hypothetical protein [Phycisphaerales bacterium]